MKNTILILFLLLLAKSYGQDPSEFIHIDQFGYPENGIKVAVLSDPQTGYNSGLSYTPSATLEVRDINDTPVFSASPVAWNGGSTHAQSGDRGWWFDFSALITPGTYYIIDPVNNERSGNFIISDAVYSDIMKAAGRMFYFNRCNSAKPAEYAENWTDDNNFSNPLQDANCRFINDPMNAALEKELTGGWFDAGDYNKYVTFTNTTLHNLLSAYEENPQAFSDNWNIPESNNSIPDIIDEIKWELDWIFKMTNPDGSVHIKMGSQNHGENAASPPGSNTDQRFYGPACSSASITVASVFAHAAKVFDDFPSLEAYAGQLRETAISCFNYSAAFVDSATYETDCDDLSIVAGDADNDANTQLANFITAAIYLYEETGMAVYNDYITGYADELEQIQSGFWGPYFTQVNDALILYAGLNTADAATANAIVNAFSQDVSNNFNGYYGFSPNDLYRAQIPDWSYHWGSNQAKASYGILNKLVIQSGVQADTTAYHNYIDEAIHYFHGVNPQNMVYLSNMYDLGAEKSVNEIYHLWFADGTTYDNALSSPVGPPPGYVTGGPNSSFSVPELVPPYNQPEQKSYMDFNTSYPDNSWEVTEPAIYYQAAYIRLLANRVQPGLPPSEEPPIIEGVFVYPNPVNDILYFNSDEEISSVSVYAIDGKQLMRIDGTTETLDLTNLSSGIYFLKINNHYIQKIVKR